MAPESRLSPTTVTLALLAGVRRQAQGVAVDGSPVASSATAVLPQQIAARRTWLPKRTPELRSLAADPVP